MSEDRVMMRKFNAILASLKRRMSTGRKMSSDDVDVKRINTSMAVPLRIHMDSRNSLDGYSRVSRIYITHSPPIFSGMVQRF